jgi:hypothetical protein
MRTISVLKDSFVKAGRNNPYTGSLEAGLQSSTLLICPCALLKCAEEEVVRSHENVRERNQKTVSVPDVSGSNFKGFHHQRSDELK